MKIEKLNHNGDQIKIEIYKEQLEIIHDALIIANGVWNSNNQDRPLSKSLNPYSDLELDFRIYLEGN